jgi:hypothetical protein
MASALGLRPARREHHAVSLQCPSYSPPVSQVPRQAVTASLQAVIARPTSRKTRPRTCSNPRATSLAKPQNQLVSRVAAGAQFLGDSASELPVMAAAMTGR